MSNYYPQHNAAPPSQPSYTNSPYPPPAYGAPPPPSQPPPYDARYAPPQPSSSTMYNQTPSAAYSQQNHPYPQSYSETSYSNPPYAHQPQHPPATYPSTQPPPQAGFSTPNTQRMPYSAQPSLSHMPSYNSAPPLPQQGGSAYGMQYAPPPPHQPPPPSHTPYGMPQYPPNAGPPQYSQPMHSAGPYGHMPSASPYPIGSPHWCQATAQDARAAFIQADRDASGYLDVQEFVNVIRNLVGGLVTYQEALQYFAKCDSDQNGRIGMNEFERLYVDEIARRMY